MTTTINGSSPSITFSDSTTQASAGLIGSTSQLCKAWVNFAGASGTINSSFNVSSVTRTATGTYTIAFTTAMSSANYVWSGDAYNSGGSGIGIVFVNNTNSAPTASNLYISTGDTGSKYDCTSVGVSVFSS